QLERLMLTASTFTDSSVDADLTASAAAQALYGDPYVGLRLVDGPNDSPLATSTSADKSATFLGMDNGVLVFKSEDTAHVDARYDGPNTGAGDDRPLGVNTVSITVNHQVQDTITAYGGINSLASWGLSGCSTSADGIASVRMTQDPPHAGTHYELTVDLSVQY